MIAKKILVVDDSALMRRVICDIITNDERFEVAGRATNGLEAFDLLSRNTYDAVVLDVNMPKMNGIQLLEELHKYKIRCRIMMNSTDTKEGAKVTLDALELGALDFIHKPDNALDCRSGAFQEAFLRTLEGVANSQFPTFETRERISEARQTNQKMLEILKKKPVKVPGNKIVAIASSTGGPKALQSVIPRLPAGLDAPVLLVQHMPVGFTGTFAERMDSTSEIKVVEASEGMQLEKGCVYIAKAGMHMNVQKSHGGTYSIHFSDEPNREGVKPCANYMYESLINCGFDNILCVVMTGMGADGTEGIKHLKERKKAFVISQNQATSTIYGMPKAVFNAGLSDQVVALDEIAQEITLRVGISN